MCLGTLTPALGSQSAVKAGGGYPQQSYGQQQGQMRPGARKLESVDVHKNQNGHCVASVQNGHESRIQQVAEFAASYKTKNGRLPSNEAVSNHFGFKCIVKWIDTPDKVVKTVRVRPDELPPSVLARF